MTESKPWWASKTIWAGVAGVLSGIAQEVGVDISAGEVRALGDSLANLAEVVFGLLTIWGRAKAYKRIK